MWSTGKFSISRVAEWQGNDPTLEEGVGTNQGVPRISARFYRPKSDKRWPWKFCLLPYLSKLVGHSRFPFYRDIGVKKNCAFCSLVSRSPGALFRMHDWVLFAI